MSKKDNKPRGKYILDNIAGADEFLDIGGVEEYADNQERIKV
jgi:hypothetical protein